MNIFKRNTYTKFLKLALILFIPFVQINSAYSFAKVIRLTATCGTYSDQTAIRIEDQATFSFDGDWDAYKLSNQGNTPNLYTELNGEGYAINSFPGEFQEFSLALNLDVNFEGNYTISVKSLLNSSIDCPYTIVLEDKLLNTSTTLEENAQYSFQATDEDMLNRFVLHYMNATSMIDDGDDSQSLTTGMNVSEEKYVDFTASNEGFTINFKNTSSTNATVSIISMDGKEVYFSDAISTQSSLTIPIDGNNASAVYIVNVLVENSIFNKKLYF